MISLEIHTVEPDITVVQVHGRISLGRSAQELEWKIEEIVKNNARKVIFDLTDVQFLDSTGIGIIVMCAGKIGEVGGQLRIAGASGNVAHTLGLCKVADIVPMFADVPQATASFTKAVGAP